MFVCEECGDLAENIADRGMCYRWGNVKEQWEDYVREHEILKAEKAISQPEPPAS